MVCSPHIDKLNVMQTKPKHKQKTTHSYYIWFLLALIAAIASSPHGVLIKSIASQIDGNLLNVLRMAVAVIVCLPMMIRDRRKVFNDKKATKNMLTASISMAVAVFTFTFSLKYAPASYVAILQLLAPLMLVIYSAMIFKEKVSIWAITGILLGISGATILIGVPYFTNYAGSGMIYPTATILMLFNALMYPLYTIHVRKMNGSQKIPMFSILGYVYLFVMVLSLVAWVGRGARLPAELSWHIWVVVMFSGLIVSGIARAAQIWSYEKIGAVPIVLLTYLEVLLAILIPVVLFAERVTIYMALGGLLIVLGILLAEWRRLVPACRMTAGHRSHTE